jgi:hypothetical protein
MNAPHRPHRLAGVKHSRPGVVTWDAKEPPRALRALLKRLANPPLNEAELECVRRWKAACEKHDAKPELDPANKDKWIA